MGLVLLMTVISVNADSNTTCHEDWNCTEWSSCVGEYETRSCIDNNLCATFDAKPIENQKCGIELETVNETVEEPIPELLLAGEPVSCGNGQIDEGESGLNCNRDIPPTIIDYLKCVSAGRTKCIYYDQYASISLVLGAIALFAAYLVFTKTGASWLSGLRRKKKITKESSQWLRKQFR